MVTPVVSAISKWFALQVDIFSLAVLMYELFVMNLMASIVMKSGEEQEFENYADVVASGHRQPMRDSWPPSLQVPPHAANAALSKTVWTPIARTVFL